MARHISARWVERLIDARPWRFLEACNQLTGDARRRLTGWWRRAAMGRNLPQHEQTSSHHPVWRRMLTLERGNDVDMLRLALAGGAYGRALDLSAVILGRLNEFDQRQRQRALPLVVETLLAHGERSRAKDLAVTHRPVLEATAAGTSLLVTLGDAAAGRRTVLPGGSLNVLGLSRRIAAGSLGVDGLFRLLLLHRGALLRNPELHLLVCDASHKTDPARATAALNRFLRVLGLPRCTVSGSWDELLSNIRFVSPHVVASRERRPLVSVIMAAHNAGQTIHYAVDSLLAQTHQRLEILVGDDASTDDTLELLTDKYATDTRIRIFSSVQNQGPYNLRNQLLQQARGDFVTFHDADDYALPNRIDTQVAHMRAGAVACYTCWLRITPGGRFVFMRDQRATRLSIVTLMTRRSVLDACGRFRSAKFGADLELREKLRHRYGDHRIAVVRRPLVFGLWSETSATRAEGAESAEDGYRAPLRRAYAECVFDGLMHDDDEAADEATQRVLEETGNHVRAVAIVEHGGRASHAPGSGSGAS